MPEKTSWESELAKLRPEARRRVEAALKQGLEAELAGESTSPLARAAEFSRGWFFSRAKPAEMLEEEVMRNTMTLDDESFRNFADRLTQLKSLKDQK